MTILGTTARGNRVSLSHEERSRHVHVLGASGTGKSKLLEGMLRGDVLAGHGLCLIDPHGTLADELVAFCASRRLADVRRIHVIEPSDLNWSFGFNPLQLDGKALPSVRVDAMVAAFAQVWGGEDTNATPLLKRCLRALFHVLAVQGLTLLETPELIRTDGLSKRLELTSKLSDSAFAATWREFNAMSAREFREAFASTQNRMLEFLSSEVVRRVVGQRERTLDLRRIMDGREILIVNLAQRGVLSADNARLIGTLLTSELFLCALSREENDARKAPFYLYIDECYDFLTSDIEKMLDQTRKFGLHLVLSHQRLGQLGDPNGPIYNGVMTGGQTKIVFGGLSDPDAEIMARETMRQTINLERPKHSLDKPVVIDEVPYWLESESSTQTSARTAGANESAGASLSAARSDSYDTYGNYQGSVSATGSSQSEGWSESESISHSRGSATGRAQTLKAVRVLMPTALHSLEEEMHLAIQKLRELPRQAAIVKRRGRLPVRISTDDIKRLLVLPRKVAQFKETLHAESWFTSLGPIADEEIRTRQASLFASRVVTAADHDFWHTEPSAE